MLLDDAEGRVIVILLLANFVDMIPEWGMVGLGIGCVVWGARRILNGNDVDEEKVLAEIPGFVREHIRRVEITPTGGLRFDLRSTAPDSAEREIEENVEVEGDGEVEVERESDA